MNVDSVLTIDNVLLAGYVFTGSLMNIVALFISTFYQHSLKQNSPQAGFVIAVMFSFVYIGLLFLGSPNMPFINILRFGSLIGYGISSSYSILMLFITMRSIRK